jgi:hypothetical protein
VIKVLLGSLVLSFSVLASAQSFDGIPSNYASDLDTMAKAANQSVYDSASVQAYAANHGLGGITNVKYVYGFKGHFVVATTKNCTFKAKAKISDFAWVANPVQGSESCH